MKLLHYLIELAVWIMTIATTAILWDVPKDIDNFRWLGGVISIYIYAETRIYLSRLK
jgi:hypothetical protein